ncbi:hypothetical protein D3C71_1634880 [compost metagenome]
MLKPHLFFEFTISGKKLSVIQQVVQGRALKKVKGYVDALFNSLICFLESGAIVIHPEVQNKTKLNPYGIFVSFAQKFTVGKFSIV